MATSTEKLIKHGEGAMAPRISVNRVMALNERSEGTKINKTLHIKLSLHHIIALCASNEISNYYIIETVDSLICICDCGNIHNYKDDCARLEE
jgi:hypothetical protein